MTVDADLFCPQCAYNLRGGTADRCPECGTPIDRTRMSVSRIPWVHRKELGHVRAYIRTLIMATLRPRLIAQDISAPVNYADGRRFAYLTITLAILLTAPVAFFAQTPMFLTATQMIEYPYTGPFLAFADQRWVMALILVCAWLALVFSFRWSQLFFCQPHLQMTMQNRAIALSQYAAAPLIFIALSLILLDALILLQRKLAESFMPEIPTGFYAIACIVCVIPPILLLACFISLLWRTTQCSFLRVVVFLVAWPTGVVCGSAIITLSTLWVSGFLAIVASNVFG